MHGKRNFGLDLARAAAITAVYFSHGVTFFAPLGIGVDLFFVLSGFLIGRIYFRSTADKTFSLWKFWQSRWARTLPPYFAALGLVALLPLRFTGKSLHWYYLLFLQNYMGVTGFGPSWSLCVEEHFYLALPLLAGGAALIFGRKCFLWVLPIAALLPQCLRTWYLVVRGGLPKDWYWMSHFHGEGLVLGILLAYLFVNRQDLWIRMRPLAMIFSMIPFLLLLGLHIHPTQSMKLHGGIFLYYALGFMGWVRILYDLKWEPMARPAQLVKEGIHGLALCSYSVYLLHSNLFIVIRLFIDNWPRGPVKSGVILSSTFLCCLVFYFLIERPTIRIRDHYLKRNRNVLTAGVPASSPEVV